MNTNNQNIALQDGFKQVCVWPGTVLPAAQVAEFVQWCADEFKTRVQFLESITTSPDRDERGQAVPDTGGRTDVFFAVHDADVGKFAIPRLSMGIRWVEDVFGNGHGGLYPERVAAYKCW
jgi:hypothetical protein